MQTEQNTQLKVGNKISTSAGEMRIISFIAAGGQGEVYKVEINGKYFALKWYFKHNINEDLIKSIKTLTIKGSPNDRFLWPIFTVEENGFGYVMDLRPHEFKSLHNYMLREFDMDLSDIAKACYLFADSFNELHSRGLSYKDISFGNVFINPRTGDILICDNDNVAVNNESIGNITGTPAFQAPEIASGKSTAPNSDTDRFSLAILLFHILCIGHPFEGSLINKIHCFDGLAKKKAYGDNPIFIFHPTDTSNRPDPILQKNPYILWEIYPQFIKDLFIQTFTDGILNVDRRAREREWGKAFIKLNGMIFSCPNCGKTELIYDAGQMKNQGHLDSCPKCHKIPKVPRMKINEYFLVCNDGRYIMELHINKLTESRRAVAQFKSIKNTLSIQNLTNGEFILTRNNQDIVIPSKTQVEIKDDDELTILGTKGKVRF